MRRDLLKPSLCRVEPPDKTLVALLVLRLLEDDAGVLLNVLPDEFGGDRHPALQFRPLGFQSRCAEEVVFQKGYGYRLAIIGDFSGYTSKALHDYIYECNNGKHLNFVADEDEAVRKLGG